MTCITKSILVNQKRQKKFEDEELEALPEEDSYQTFKELSKILNVDESTVSKRLKAMGMIQKIGNWIPHELRERDITKYLTICESASKTKTKVVFASNCD